MLRRRGESMIKKTVIMEPTSANTVIALSFVAAAKGISLSSLSR
jgi:cysteine synthase